MKSFLFIAAMLLSVSSFSQTLSNDSLLRRIEALEQQQKLAQANFDKASENLIAAGGTGITAILLAGVGSGLLFVKDDQISNIRPVSYGCFVVSGVCAAISSGMLISAGRNARSYKRVPMTF